MNFALEFIKWWYVIVGGNYFHNQVLSIFIFSMNKTRALPFAKTFNIPLYRDKSDFGSGLSKIIKFWWIAIGTILSIIKVIPGLVILLFLLILPFIPLFGIIRFMFKI